MAGTELRVATWNLNHRGLSAAAGLGEFLRKSSVDLVLFQEANISSLPAVCQEAGLEWVVDAFQAGADRPLGRSGRWRVTALAGRGNPPDRVGVLPGLALPERMVFGHVQTPIGALVVASYHAPPGVSWGMTKVHHAHALADWVDNTPGPVVVGADANTPEVDHPDPENVRTHWHTGSRKLNGAAGDDQTFGGSPRHRLRDAYRDWLQAHPAVQQEIVRQRPHGPLAVSHRTGKRRTSPGTPRRFDALWVSPELEVSFVGYDYEGAVAAGTDHALVVADLSIGPPSSPPRDGLQDSRPDSSGGSADRTSSR